MKDNPPNSDLNHLRKLFDEVIDLPVGERDAFIKNTFPDKPYLRQRLIAMVEAHENRESGFEMVWKDAVWPVLKSLNENISQVESLLQRPVDEALAGADSLIGKDLSHFHIMESIGRGGMGMVYKARDRDLDRYVALKFLPPSIGADPSSKKRFIKEAKTASALDHLNIATVHEIGETDDHQMYIAMAYYEGQSLKDLIAQAPLRKEQAIGYAIQLAGALDKAHQNGVVHRDVKSGNLIVTKEGIVKLLDFGLAKLTFESGYTQVGELMGTVAYMSPEQARGEVVDYLTDIWSFGVVLFEMLTGRRPFEGDNLQHTIHSILQADPFEGSDARAIKAAIPKPLRTVIEVCLAKDPAERYQSAADLERDLKRVAEGLAPLVRLHPIKRVLRKKQSKLAGAVLVSIAVAATWLALLNNQEITSVTGITFTRVSGGELAQHRGGFGGAYWGDYDADGFVDFFTGGLTPMLFHNEGDGTFSRATDSGIDNDLISSKAYPFKALWADFENDGDIDLYITYFNLSTGDFDRFFLNNGDGTFKRAQFDWIPSTSAASASWGDIDNDGLLDLFVGRFKFDQPGLTVFHHQKDHSMIPLAVSIDRSTGSIFSDFDLDGDVDLIAIANPNFIYRNDGALTFTQLSETALPGAPVWEGTSFGIAMGDYDNDGDFDVFLSDYSYNRLYRNDLDEGFVEMKRNAITEESSLGSCLLGDYDNDGFLDLMFTNPQRLLYHNEGDGTFSRVENIPMVEEKANGAGGAWADYDNDGDLDMLFGDGILLGMKMADPPSTMALYRNDGGTNNWITFTLVGVKSNRSAIGAKVFLQAIINGKPVRQLREVTCGGGQGHLNDMRVHFGLGDAEVIESLRIEWPSGQVDEYKNIEPNQFLTLVEGNTKLRSQ